LMLWTMDTFQSHVTVSPGAMVMLAGEKVCAPRLMVTVCGARCVGVGLGGTGVAVGAGGVVGVGVGEGGSVAVAVGSGEGDGVSAACVGVPTGALVPVGAGVGVSPWLVAEGVAEDSPSAEELPPHAAARARRMTAAAATRDFINRRLTGDA